MNVKNTFRTKFTKFFGIIFLFLIWEFLADIIVKNYDILPNIFETYQVLKNLLIYDNSFMLFKSIFATLVEVSIVFLFSYVVAAIFSTLSYRFVFLKDVFSPTITVLRSMPTIAAIMVILMIVPWDALSLVVGFTVVFPLVYSVLTASFEDIPCGEIDAAKSLGFNFLQCIKHVFIPNMLNDIKACIISGFGLCYKVVIAAQVFGYPRDNMGHMIYFAKQSLDFRTSFAYLLISVIIMLIIEWVLRKVFRSNKSSKDSSSLKYCDS